jgi:hypothetical protein
MVNKGLYLRKLKNSSGQRSWNEPSTEMLPLGPGQAGAEGEK